MLAELTRSISLENDFRIRCRNIVINLKKKKKTLNDFTMLGPIRINYPGHQPDRLSRLRADW